MSEVSTGNPISGRRQALGPSETIGRFARRLGCSYNQVWMAEQGLVNQVSPTALAGLQALGHDPAEVQAEYAAWKRAQTGNPCPAYEHGGAT